MLIEFNFFQFPIAVAIKREYLSTHKECSNYVRLNWYYVDHFEVNISEEFKKFGSIPNSFIQHSLQSYICSPCIQIVSTSIFAIKFNVYHFWLSWEWVWELTDEDPNKIRIDRCKTTIMNSNVDCFSIHRNTRVVAKKVFDFRKKKWN